MSERKNYFSFYETFEEQLSGLPEELQAKFYMAIIKYGLHEQETEFDNPLEEAIFKQFKFAIDNQRAKSKAQVENGNKGGRPKTQENPKKANETQNNPSETQKKPTETQNNPSETQKKPTETQNNPSVDEEEIEIELEKEIETERESETSANAPLSNPQPQKDKKTAGKFKPPTVGEVAEYCLERRNGVNPDTFCSFYESKGWLVGRNKMSDWKAAVRTWERRDKERHGGAGTVWQTEHDAAADYMDLL